MQYKERIIAKLREQLQPGWEEYLAQNKVRGLPEITLEEHLEILFNQRVNCGGYALEVDACIFPAYNGNFDQVVSGLLERLPFIRLLGDTQLLEDEYLVAYRAHEYGGHHFIKIQEGRVTEKNESNKIQEFSSWPRSLKHSPQAVFAVKKEHDMVLKKKNGDQMWSLMLDDILGKDFDATVESAILNGQIDFSYHQHEYSLKKNTEEEDRAFIYSRGRVVGEIMIDEGECIVDIKEEERDYVSNTIPENPEYLEILNSFEDIEL